MIKTYPLVRSPLYRMRNKRKLARYLKVSKKYLTQNHIGEYEDETRKTKNGKTRTIYKSFGKLKKVQRQICKLMMRIETPNYIYSGKKKVSYIDNARNHRNSKYLLALDIYKYYESVKKTKVYDMFINTFLMENDIAWIMTKLVMHNKTLPTGSPSSMLVAYWTYKDMFDEIEELSAHCGCRLTIYVDDITISSSKPISNEFVDKVDNVIMKNGLKLNMKKKRYYQGSDYKEVAGVGLLNSQLKVLNRARKETIDLYEKCKKTEDIFLIESLKGKVNSLRQIEPNIFPEIYGFISHYEKELKELAKNRNKNSIKK